MVETSVEHYNYRNTRGGRAENACDHVDGMETYSMRSPLNNIWKLLDHIEYLSVIPNHVVTRGL